MLGLGAISSFGPYRVRQKHGLSEAELLALRKDDVPHTNRSLAGYYSGWAQTASDYLCYGSPLAAPGLLVLSSVARGRYGQVAVLYLEIVLTTDAIFTSTVGNVHCHRSCFCGAEGSGDRTGKITTNSFFTGHTAIFFAVKVFQISTPARGPSPTRGARRPPSRWLWRTSASRRASTS